jgi:hypothetical protein
VRAKVDYTELDELTEGIFLCKALWQHPWEKNPSPRNINGEVARRAYRILCLRCTRCRRERYDYLGSKGQRIGRYYVNPHGYPKTHRFTSDQLMLEMIRRSVLVTTYNGKKGAK